MIVNANSRGVSFFFARDYMPNSTRFLLAALGLAVICFATQSLADETVKKLEQKKLVQQTKQKVSKPDSVVVYESKHFGKKVD